jgi:uncharacterized protein YdaU (DUF1376 family)
MKPRPWMPLYVADYLNDTMHLTVAESGAYMNLILFYWVNGGLPNDEKAIARITRLGPMGWKRSRGTLVSFFNDDWSHDRIDREIAKAIEISKVNSANAKRRHYGRATVADTLTPTPTYKNGNGKSKEKGKKEGFKCYSTSKEFIAWKAFAFAGDVPLWRELQKREEEGRGFDFPSRWPPGHKEYAA